MPSKSGKKSQPEKDFEPRIQDIVKRLSRLVRGFESHWERHLFKLSHASQAVSNKCPIFRRDLTRWSSRQIAFALCSKSTCSIRIGRRSAEASRACPEFSAAPVATRRTVTAFGPEGPGDTSAHLRVAARLRAPGGQRFRLSPGTPRVNSQWRAPRIPSVPPRRRGSQCANGRGRFRRAAAAIRRTGS